MRYLLALFTSSILITSTAAHAGMSNGTLSAEDEATYKDVCALYEAADNDCQCMIKHAVDKMGAEKVSLALTGQRILLMADTKAAEKLNDEAISKAGSESALDKIDEDFTKINDEAVLSCRKE
jgi:hypothetical protein